MVKTPTQSWSWKLIFGHFVAPMSTSKPQNMSFQLQLWVGVLSLLDHAHLFTRESNFATSHSTGIKGSMPSRLVLGQKKSFFCPKTKRLYLEEYLELRAHILREVSSHSEKPENGLDL